MTLKSKVAAAQDAIEALLAAATGLESYECTYTAPVPIPEYGIFILPRYEAERDTPLSGGVLAQDEEFTVSFVIHVHRTGLTAKEVRDLADTAEGIAEDTIAANPTLSGAVSFARVVHTEGDGGWWNDSGTEQYADRKLDVLCTAYIG